MQFYLYLILMLFLFSFSAVFSDELSHADSHGPISLGGDHLHKKGEFMFSYKFGHMNMNDLMNGNKTLSTNEVMNAPNFSSDGTGTYMNAPIFMKMDMHMLGMMYAPKNFLTFMIMTNYNEKEMIQQKMKMSGGQRFNVNSSGFGDLKILGLIKVLKKSKQTTHLGFGFSLPTGSIDKRDNTPASLNTRLGYAMQNGTGTFDPIFSFTNINSFEKIKLGQQVIFHQPLLGKNSKGYKYGKEINSSVWTSLSWRKNFSTSLKVSYNFKDQMTGHDNEMNKRMSPAMDSCNHGHQKVNLGFGFNFVNHGNFLKNNRLALEGIVPLFQNYHGIQMSENFKIILGWQYGF